MMTPSTGHNERRRGAGSGTGGGVYGGGCRRNIGFTYHDEELGRLPAVSSSIPSDVLSVNEFARLSSYLDMKMARSDSSERAAALLRFELISSSPRDQPGVPDCTHPL